MPPTPPLLPALLAALPGGVLVFDREKALLCENPAGHAWREHLSHAPGEPWRLGDISLDAVLHRILEGDETIVFDSTGDGRGRELHLRAARVELEAERHALLLLSVMEPVDEAAQLRADRERRLAQLLPGLAHEIRGPLTTISGLSQVLALTPTLSEDVRLGLELVPAQIDRADALLRSVVAFARGPRGTSDLPIPLNEVVGRALDLVAYPFRARAIELGCDLEPGMPLIDADPEELLQIVLSLVMAALDAAGDSGCKGPVQLQTRTRAGRVAELSLTCPAARPEDLPAALEPAWSLLPRLGAEGCCEAAEPGTARITLRLRGWTELGADPGRASPRSVLVAEPDLDLGLGCLRALGALASRTTLTTSTDVVRRRLEQGRVGAALLDLGLTAGLDRHLLPQVTVLSAPAGQECRAEALAKTLGVEWAPKRDASGRLSILLGLEPEVPVAVPVPDDRQLAAPPRPRRRKS